MISEWLPELRHRKQAHRRRAQAEASREEYSLVGQPTSGPGKVTEKIWEPFPATRRTRR